MSLALALFDFGDRMRIRSTASMSNIIITKRKVKAGGDGGGDGASLLCWICGFQLILVYHHCIVVLPQSKPKESQIAFNRMLTKLCFCLSRNAANSAILQTLHFIHRGLSKMKGKKCPFYEL